MIHRCLVILLVVPNGVVHGTYLGIRMLQGVRGADPVGGTPR